MSTDYDALAPRACNDLLRDHARRRRLSRRHGTYLNFCGLPAWKDAYNITAPFSLNGKRYLAARVESRASDWVGKVYDPRISFFLEGDIGWVMAGSVPVSPLEDPAVALIGGELVVSGIEVYDDSNRPSGREFRTVFFRGGGVGNLRRFAEGPAEMKDIRLVELPSGAIGVFTRPQGGTAGLGKIGFTSIPSLDAIDAPVLESAPLLADSFLPDEWGGVNQAIVLPDARIGCVGHIASRHDNGSRHYYAMAFAYDPYADKAAPLRIIATRADFPAAPPKSSDIDDCLFPGGIERHDDGTATLYAGVADAYGGSVRVPDPFTG